MKRIFAAALALGIAGALAAGPTSAQEASPEEVKICKETIKEMTGGNPPEEAVKLCEQGKLNEAIEKAMAG